MDSNKSGKNLVENFKTACIEAGLKLTHQRLEIYKELTSAKDHPSAEGLYKKLKERIPTISLDTVYRNLSTLSDHGLIRRLETAESQARFDGDIDKHYHAICSNCKEIEDFYWEEFDKIIHPNLSFWGKAKDVNVVIYGTCSKCLHKEIH